MSRPLPPVVVTICKNHMIGHDAATGAQVFLHRLGESSIGFARVVAVNILEVLVTTSRIFVAAGQSVYCFEYPSGRPIGEVQLPGGPPWGADARATLLQVGDQLLVGVAGMLHCVSEGGQLLWSAPGYTSPPVRDSMGIAVPGSARQADDKGAK